MEPEAEADDALDWNNEALRVWDGWGEAGQVNEYFDDDEDMEEDGDGGESGEVPPYEEGGVDEDEDEAAREDLLMLVEGWANAHLHEWSG